MRVAIEPTAVWQEIDGVVVLLSMGSEGRYYKLDDVASRMWLVLAEDGDVDAAVRRLLDEFEVDERTLRADLERVIGELAAARLMRVER